MTILDLFKIKLDGKAALMTGAKVAVADMSPETGCNASGASGCIHGRRAAW